MLCDAAVRRSASSSSSGAISSHSMSMQRSDVSSDTRAAFGIAILSNSIPYLRKSIAQFAIDRRLPTMASQREQALAGILMSFGTSTARQLREAAKYVDKILKGVSARRSANRATEAVRTGDRYEDREVAWPHDPAITSAARRRDHRMNLDELRVAAQGRGQSIGGTISVMNARFGSLPEGRGAREARVSADLFAILAD